MIEQLKRIERIADIMRLDAKARPSNSRKGIRDTCTHLINPPPAGAS